MEGHTVEIRMDRRSAVPFDVIERVEGKLVKIDSFRSLEIATRTGEGWASTYSAVFVGKVGFGQDCD